MIAHAFSYSEVEFVEAHTLAERNASTRVLEKVGMKLVETINDPREGPHLALVGCEIGLGCARAW